MAKTKASSMAPEESLPVSPARPLVREWATSSYDPKTGRPCVYEPGPDRFKQVPKAGTHTEGKAGRAPFKPGRW